MSDAALGWITLLVLGGLGTVVVALWWHFQVRDDPEGFYRRLHENEMKRRESGPPGV